MAAPIRIAGGYIDGDNNEGHHAQVDKNGNLRVREGHHGYLNKTYEDTSFVALDSPVVHDFNTDTGRNAVDGWLICDGPGDISVDFTRDGTTYGDQWTMKSKDVVDLLRLDINKIRITHSGTDSAYRIFLI